MSGARSLLACVEEYVRDLVGEEEGLVWALSRAFAYPWSRDPEEAVIECHVFVCGGRLAQYARTGYI